MLCTDHVMHSAAVSRSTSGAMARQPKYGTYCQYLETILATFSSLSYYYLQEFATLLATPLPGDEESSFLTFSGSGTTLSSMRGSASRARSRGDSKGSSERTSLRNTVFTPGTDKSSSSSGRWASRGVTHN